MLIHGFHPQMLEICSMHTLNLGIAFNMNGASMSLAQHLSGVSVWWQRFFLCFRAHLLRIKFFIGETLEAAFDEAFEDFRQFLKTNKITCSQPRFRPGMAPWLL